jgi:NAD(P)-dependent dehydrogenase (short-subunit alcohol dehydrogenase family)
MIATETGRSVIAIRVNVSVKEEVDTMVEETVSRLGAIDICFANAGISEPGLPIRDVENYHFEYWNKVIAVNLTGVYLTNMAAAKAMRAAGRGVIVNMASIMGLVADSAWGTIGYTAAKGGVVQLTRQMSFMLASHGIRVNAIAPGYVATGASEAEQPDHEDPVVHSLQREVLFRTPLGRYANAAELKGIALFLASDASSYCTGYTYAVDGGWLAA